MTAPHAGRLLELIGALGTGPHRPVLVCHLADGARTELSRASLANWTAKVAGLLRDELGLAPGERAAVLPRFGWQLAPVLLGCWWAGLTVTGPDDPAAAVAFVAPGADTAAEEVFVLSGHPLGAPATGMAAHQRDFTAAVLPQSDRLGAPAVRDDGWVAARDGAGAVPASRLMQEAADVADRMRSVVPQGRRPVVISTLEWGPPGWLAHTLLAALAADGSLVHCPAGLPADRVAAIATAEHASVAVGTDLAGIPVIP